jgi:hypothetical protein
MMFQQLVDFLRKNVVKALAAMGLGSALVSAVITDFSSSRASNREFMKHQFEVSEQADRELLPLIRKFSEKALGKGQTNDADLSSLKARVDNSYLVATKIVERLPKATPDFKPYVESLTELQKCAEIFQSAADGQCWVQAVSQYAARKQAFEQKVTTLQTGWP